MPDVKGVPGLKFKKPAIAPEDMVRPKVPWFSYDLKELRLDMRRAERKWVASKIQADLSNYKIKRNLFVYKLKGAKINHINELVEECSNDSGKLFKLVDNLTGRSKNSIFPEGDPKTLAANFGDYFIQKIDQIRSNLPTLEVPSSSIREDVPCFSAFSEISVDQVKNIVLSSKNTQCLSDPFPTRLLKDNINVIAPVVTKLVNLSFTQGSFCKDWKHAIVKPLMKKHGDDTSLSNYRPVSNLSFVSKVCEKAALSQLSEHINQNCLLPPCQSAYRKGYSTETALVKVVNDLLLSTDQGSITLMVMLDLSAAFDTVDHKILLNVLEENFGVKGDAKSWFDNYLRPRCQSIQIHNELSKKYDMKQGVPQGSCMGPVLFTVYASTLFEIIGQHLIKVMGYADDHMLYISFQPKSQTNEINALSELENCLAEVKKWMDRNTLKMNSSKTEFICFGSSTNLSKLGISEITIDNDRITKQNVVKYLGVYLDQNLSMSKQINEKCKIASYNLHNIRKLRKFLSVQSTKSLVHSLVTSHFDYCNAIMYGLPNYQIQRIQRIQNMAARLVLNLDKTCSISQALRDLHWLPIKQRINYKILLLTYNALNAFGPSYIKDLLKFRSSKYSLRSTNDLKLEVPRTRCKTFGDRAFSVCAPQLWNALPLDIKLSPTVGTFKTKLKTHFFKQTYSS